MENSTCSFLAIVGGHCGPDTKDRTGSVEMVPLLSCNRDISRHKSFFSIIGMENETELLLARASIFTPPRNVENWIICPQHRASLGVSWKRSSPKCLIPVSLSNHNATFAKKPKAERGLSKSGSQIVLKETGIFVPVGAGVCSNCRKLLGEAESKTAAQPPCIKSEVILQMGNMSLDNSIGATPVAQSTPASVYFGSNVQTPGGSLYLPSESSLNVTPDSLSTRRDDSTPLTKLNEFLDSRDVSPVRHTLTVSWDEAGERTRRRHIRKAQQAVGAVLEEVAPKQSEKLWYSLVPSLNQQFSTDSESVDKDVDNVLMNALTECYSNASAWDTRRQILSIMADKVSFQTLKKWIPDLTRYRFSTARKHTMLHGRGVPPPQSSQTKLFVSPTQVDHFLDFITSPHVIQDLPFGEKTITLSTSEVVTVPNVIRMLIPESIVKQYLAYAEESNFTPLSRRTLLKILSVCAASTRKSLQGLDYITSAGAQAFEDLTDAAKRLGDHLMGMTWAKEQRERLMSAKRYLKSDYKVHVSKESCVADHCRQYALSDPKDRDFQVLCDHQHTDQCDRCDAMAEALLDIKNALAMMTEENIGADVKEELSFIADQAISNIQAWKAHLLRSLNQDQARLDVIDELDESSVLLVEDWAMKFLPRKYRESQHDWFGKRGLSWHVTVATRKMVATQQLQMMTFVHVIQSCSQDSNAVLAIMEDVIGKLKAIMPTLKTVIYRQDNAGCYRSGATIIGASKASQYHGVTVKRLDFSDPQAGKGACDRKAATIKAHMRIHLNEGNDIESAAQMVDAMRSLGGVPGLHVTLCEMANTRTSANVKFDGVSGVSNVEYGEDCITTWKAYGIGPGKTVKLSKFTRGNNETPIPRLSRCVEDVVVDKFTSLQSRSAKPETMSSLDESPDDTASSQLFFCPEEGCIKSYQRFAALQHHLDLGKHERKLERETLLDKAVHGYAARLEKQTASVPQLQQCAESRRAPNRSLLPMGWALKTSQASRARFTDKQKNYLLTKFLLGEQTGQKLNTSSVARSMMSARDGNGDRLFTSNEFLTGQQIAGYFSRLASKRALQSSYSSQSESDDEIAEAEMVLSDLRGEVLENVQPLHPISFEHYNLCELMAQAKLSTFAISMLKKICDYFEIPTGDIKGRKKAPYLSRIEELLKKCSCCSP